MKRILLLMSCIMTIFSINAQLGAYKESYIIDSADVMRAHVLLTTSLKQKVVMPNPHPDAQWYPDASLGLFMHWGIHSVAGAQPSWDMISNYKYGGKQAPPDRYYALANEFNPQKYNPSKFLKAIKNAGFTYAVLTTKHHDGYALWPSKYGIGTKQYMNGRDLIKPYVEACRENGLKVGFYFSPRDWHYPGLMDVKEFNANTMHEKIPIKDSIANYKNFERFLGFVMVQLEELLTRYGKIDVLWLDGMSWNGVSDLHTEQIYRWIRTLQPGIVINDRWSNVVNPDNPSGEGIKTGDFMTPFECIKPTYIPSKWWEHCDIWTTGGGGWGYDKKGKFRSYQWFFDHLITTRSLGGNFLINVGPDGDGEMHPNFYKNVAAIAEWMKLYKESVIGAARTPGVDRSNVMITTRNKIWYLHLLPDFKKQVSLQTNKKPVSIKLMRTGGPISYLYNDGFVTFTLAPEYRTDMDDVVTVQF